MRSCVAWISVIAGFLFVIEGCTNDPPPVITPAIVPVQFGCFTFNVTDEWKITHSVDTLFLERDSCTIKVSKGFNLTFALFRTLPPTKLPDLTIPEMEMLKRYFPSPFYPDSLPDSLAALRFGVSIDSLVRRYTCYSDSSNFPSEFLAVHPQSGNSIHFETTSGHTEADSLFDLIAESIRFVPVQAEPSLIGFSFTDTAVNCCDELLPDGSKNPHYKKSVIRVRDTIIEYWTSVRFDERVVDHLDHSMQIKGDSIFVNAFAGLYDMEYFEHSDIIASPPHMVIIQCDCWTCKTLYYKIDVPKGATEFKIKFTGETVSVGEAVLLR